MHGESMRIFSKGSSIVRIFQKSVLSFAILLSCSFSTAAESTALPQTEYGHPDLQGVWFYGTGTPYERPIDLGNARSFTAEEAQQQLQVLRDADANKARPLAAGRSAPAAGSSIAQTADFNFASSRTNLVNVNGLFRTSQIILPENGRLPFRDDAKDIFAAWAEEGKGAYDGPEIRPVSERCVGPNGGPMAPMVSWFYNANIQFFQTQNYVILLAEMNHDARIIPLSAEPTSYNFPQWMGHSHGVFEDDTLVVTTAGFRPEQSWFAFRMSGQLTVTERFKLVSKNEILYSFTFEDPAIYTEPVTVEKNIVRREQDENLFEYACHEGNYSYPGILAGARRLEQD
jgi:hypothetical protein